MSRTALWVFAWLPILSLAAAAEPAADSCMAGATGCVTRVAPEDQVEMMQKLARVTKRTLSGGEEGKGKDKKEFTIACKWEHIAEDMHLGDANADEDDYHWGLCTTSDETPVTYSILDDDTTAGFGSGDHVKIKITRAKFEGSLDKMGEVPSLPEQAGMQIFSNTDAPKTMKMLLIFCDYDDVTPYYTD